VDAPPTSATSSAPPVVIGRIEVHVDPPATTSDPFAGCRVVAAGLTARTGGGW
jgi:phage terminase large subunit-like protein